PPAARASLPEAPLPTGTTASPSLQGTVIRAAIPSATTRPGRARRPPRTPAVPTPVPAFPRFPPPPTPRAAPSRGAPRQPRCAPWGGPTPRFASHGRAGTPDRGQRAGTRRHPRASDVAHRGACPACRQSTLHPGECARNLSLTGTPRLVATWRRPDEYPARCTSLAHPQFPPEPIRRHRPDPDPPHVHAPQVVRCAEAGQVRHVVRPARRPIGDVVRMRRGAAADWHLAEAPVAPQHPLGNRARPQIGRAS